MTKSKFKINDRMIGKTLKLTEKHDRVAGISTEERAKQKVQRIHVLWDDHPISLILMIFALFNR